MERAKIVARFADGRVLKGYTLDFSPDASRFHLMPSTAATSPGAFEVALKELKAIFFVRNFSGNPRYREQKHFDARGQRLGREVEVVFGDGEVLVGHTLSYDPERPGFFLFPADPRSNNLRVFAIFQAVRRVRAAIEGGENGPAPGAPNGGMAMVGLKVMGDIEGVVDLFRRTVSDWETLVRSVETLSRENGELQTRCGELERELDAQRAAHERHQREHQAALGTVSQLRSARDALGVEHEAVARALRDLRDQHEATLRDREAAAEELTAILRRLHA